MQVFKQLISLNSLEDWLVAFGFFVATSVVLFILRPIIVKRIRTLAEKTETHWDDVFAEMVAATKGLSIIAVSLYVGCQHLSLSGRLTTTLDKALILVLMIQLGLWGSRGIGAWMHEKSSRGLAAGNPEAATHLGVAGFILRLILWATIALATLNNLGFDITALVASLGIGGVAVALAVQNILGDLFASLSIALDRPFLVGDFIVVDSLQGTVKHVGLKTTRIQSLGGEELIVSNNDLLKSRIRNYKRMAERRIVFNFGVSYDTPADVLETLPTILKELVETHANVRFDRAHFKNLGQSSLDFEAVYHVLDPEMSVYLDIQQTINLALIRRFAAMGVEFAFPTQTVHIASLPKNFTNKTS